MTQDNELELREKHELTGEGTRPGAVFQPEIDIIEHPDGFVIHADLPGADEDSVDVRFERGLLTLDAKLATLPDESWQPIHLEYGVGTYHRRFRLSDDIDANGVSARMQSGVLELHLPKTAERQPRAIPVTAE